MLDHSNQEHPSRMSFDSFIGELVKQTEPIRQSSDQFQIIERTRNYSEDLASAYKHLSKLVEKKKITTSGMEWFLDNYYVIQKAIDLVQEDLPEEYFRKLPSPIHANGIPRIYLLTEQITAHFQADVVLTSINRVLTAYQEQISLQMSELWAFPLMLRLVMIEVVTATIFELVEGVKAAHEINTINFPDLKPDEVVARTIRSLVLFEQMDWKSLFESQSKVEKVLQTDPARVYSRMDFETRDQYRKKVEFLAERSPLSEIEIAEAAIKLAKKAPKTCKKTNHVGYFLIAEGEGRLKQEIKFKPDFREKFKTFFNKHNTSFYIGSILTITLLVTIGLMLIARIYLPTTWQWLLSGFLSLIPASSMAVNLVNSILTTTLPPRILPKMDFSRKIPRDFRTMVAIPALLTNSEELDFLLRQLEMHYLANNDTNIGFVLLTDYSDAPHEEMPEDEVLLEAAVAGIENLNAKYQGDHGRHPFYIFHRRRQWNAQEDAWMGWERKRGKLADFNRFLLEGYKDSFDTIVGELTFVKDIRFVITLDADTIIPRDGANSLIATLAHPLNQAEFKPGTSHVVSGYTILQPRTEVKPTSVNQSLFTRVFAGDLGLDLYTRAVSDVYQDLFGEGIYVGKGIYDVAAFSRSLEGKAPQNSLLSHDLFEGIEGRAALVSDVVFFEDYPPDYASQVNRLHRWVRGDWQLVPWLMPKVPVVNGKKEKNPFSVIDRWKILDNLRRSLLSPAVLLALLTGWLLFQNGAWLWTLLILFVSAFTLVKNVVSSLTSRFILGVKTNIISNISTALFRWLFWLIFLPYESLVMIDAAITTLIRVYISHKRLIQWTTSAHTVRLFGKKRKISTNWRKMIIAPITSLVIGILVYLVNPPAFWNSIPLLLIWAFSPQIAYWVSMVRKPNKKVVLTSDEIAELRQMARRTWLYFERFIGPDDHWLPPDHYQEDPKGAIAHRTSPTNIGLMLLSTASAYDLGYIGVMDFVYRMNYTFETLDGLEKYRGHLLNWYDTQTLKTLSPRYVSTVDSGNYAASLIGLAQALKAVQIHGICPERIFDGIFDSFDVFCTLVKKIDNEDLGHVVGPLHTHCVDVQQDILEHTLSDSRQIELLNGFEDRLTRPINELIAEILNTDQDIGPSVLQDMRYWSDAIYQQLSNIKSQIKQLAPWTETWRNRPPFLDQDNEADLLLRLAPWLEERTLQLPLADIPHICDNLRVNLEAHNTLEIPGLDLSADDLEIWLKWRNQFIQDLNESKKNVESLLAQIDTLTGKIEFYLERMEFGFLFDKQREVFYLGYSVGSGRMDRNHYDLLASEARTASLVSIAMNEVPRSHWLHMSRPITSIHNIPTLISWNGSMFEYLMPNLFTHTYPDTLLELTSKGVVIAQIDYAKHKQVPWGISESSYYRFDQAENYQYQGFGLPALGRKRGLADDLVIAPYASLMAVDVNPKAVIANIKALKKEGALGQFGFYESIDYTPARLPVGKDKAVVKTYMAHHQGMILVALGNYLSDTSLVDLIHEDPRIESTELLLQEQIPHADANKTPRDNESVSRVQGTRSVNIQPWQPKIHEKGLSVHTLSNGNLHLVMTDSGSGYLAWRDIALTRWRQDAALDPFGIWFFVQDLDKDQTWSIGSEPIQNQPDEYRVFFAPYSVEIRRVQNDVRANLRTTIAPEDDICIQKLVLTNQSSFSRCFRIFSYGEVVLAPQATDRRHPAFNKMFIESEYDEALHMLHFHRRKRSADEPPRGMAHLVYDSLPGKIEWESDRARFIGRGHDLSNPLAVSGTGQMTGTVGTTLDPIFSLARRMTLKPHEAVTFNFLTLAAETREEAVEIANKYRDEMRINNTFAIAETSSERVLQSIELDSPTLAKYQQLLSHILYPTSELRPEPWLLSKNSLGQSGLWPYGISGDYPIFLVIIDQQDDLEALQETLQAHAYWRKMGLMIDLVILNTKDVSYAQELDGRIQQAITVMDGADWVNRRGGIFNLTASQMSSDSIILLKTAARVVIDLHEQQLDMLLKKVADVPPSLPPFIATESGEEFQVDRQIERPKDLQFANGFGGFTADGEEYQIYLEGKDRSDSGSNEVTPAPWINVIANQDFGFMVSESGGGYTWALNSGENRLTPWTNDPVSDPSGEALYLRDEITGQIWTPTPAPAGKDVNYLIRHGQGYSVFESINNGFQQEMKLFIAPNAPVKIVELALTNLSQKHRRLTATYFAEWVLGVDRQSTQAFIVPDFDNDTGSLLTRNAFNREFSDRVAFLSTNLPIHGLTTDRREFLGEPGSRQRPVGLTRIGLSGHVKAGTDPCAALQTHLNIAPGETQKVVFVLGQGKDLAETKELAAHFSNLENIAQTWDDNISFWDTLLKSLEIHTPEPQMDLLLNHWLQYQTLSCRIWGRSAFYQSSGAYGFRDQLQDVASLLAMKPEIARSQILRAAAHQFEAGDVLHWWHPPSGRGVRTRITDDLLWLVFVTAEYVKQTGDRGILEEKIPFLLGKPLEKDEEERYDQYQSSQENYTLFEHCHRALEKGDTQGPHGLPLIGTGDWNDGMNRVGVEGKGESVWLAWFLRENHQRFAGLCDLQGQPELAKHHNERAESLAQCVNEVAWDGEWYLRAFYDDGTPLGSHLSQECQIDSLTQSWSVLTGGGPAERQAQAMDSVKSRLVQLQDRLILLFTPPFNHTKKDPGYIKGYPPGIRENGGQYTHAAVWAVWALTEMGQGTEAFKYFNYLNPITHSNDLQRAELYAVEPYVVAADIYSTAPFEGRGGWTWYSGSSGWLHRLGTEAILGFKLRGNHFTIDPCIPDAWDRYELTYRKDGTTYHITVNNPEHVERGIKQVTLDGEILNDHNIPIKADQNDHEVVVTMGKMA